MSDTKQILSFMKETRNTLGTLVDRLASVRYDLVGSRPDPTPEPTKIPGAPPRVSDMCLTDGVEYFAGDINETLNRLNHEIEHLASRVNHKEVAQAAAGKAF